MKALTRPIGIGVVLVLFVLLAAGATGSAQAVPPSAFIPQTRLGYTSGDQWEPAIATDRNANACVMPGYTTAQLQRLDQGGTVTSGGFSVTQLAISDPSFGSIKSNLIAGGFFQVTAFQLKLEAAVY